MNNYFDSEQGLVKLLEDHQELFNMIDGYGKQFVQGILSTSDDYKGALNQLTGAYIILQPIYSTAIAHKLNDELKYYANRKGELETSGEKVVATHLEKEASLSVNEVRRVRNVLEGYVLACEKGIVTCQTQLKRIEEDSKYKPQE